MFDFIKGSHSPLAVGTIPKASELFFEHVEFTHLYKSHRVWILRFFPDDTFKILILGQVEKYFEVLGFALNVLAEFLRFMNLARHLVQICQVF